MKRRGMSPQERREYERLQQRKRRQRERRDVHGYEYDKDEDNIIGYDELDEITLYDYDDDDEYEIDLDYDDDEEETAFERWINRGERKNKKRAARYDNRDSRRRADDRGERRYKKRRRNPFHNLLPGLHGLMALAFMGMMFLVNVLPLEYLLILAAVLFILWGIGYLSNAKGKKGYNIFMILILGIGVFYAGKISGALGDITGGGNQVNMNINSQPFSVYVSGIDVYGDIGKKAEAT